MLTGLREGLRVAGTRRPASTYDDRPSRPVAARLRRLRLANDGAAPVVDPSQRVTVVMTTHGRRVQSAWMALESIADGEVLPARLVLVVESRDLARGLPEALQRLERRGLEIVEESRRLGVHAKWHHVAQDHRGMPVVTSDDDIVYPSSWLRELLETHAQHPHDVVAHRAVEMVLGEAKLAPYTSWPRCRTTKASPRHFGTSVSGQVIPPSVLDRALADGDRFLELTPTSDDIWLHRAAVRAGVGVRQVGQLPAHFPFVPGTQTEGLYRENVFGGGNDEQLRVAYEERDLDVLRAAPAATGDEHAEPPRRGAVGPWRAALEAALGRTPRALRGIDPDSTVVVVCQWRRVGMLAALLDDLSAQRDARVTLVIWNNHGLTGRAIRGIVARHGRRGALVDVRVVQRRRNLGGIGRFVVARHLFEAGRRGPIVTVDDDMRLGPTVVRDLLAAWSPRSIVGHWAWEPDPDDYHQRVAVADGEPAGYVGTGGAALDLEIADDEFFDLLPDRYGAVEDLWACARAAVRGWALRRVQLDVDYIDDGHDQYVRLPERKLELWRLRSPLARGDVIEVPPDPHAGLGRVTVRETFDLVRGAVVARVSRLRR